MNSEKFNSSTPIDEVATTDQVTTFENPDDKKDPNKIIENPEIELTKEQAQEVGNETMSAKEKIEQLEDAINGINRTLQTIENFEKSVPDSNLDEAKKFYENKKQKFAQQLADIKGSSAEAAVEGLSDDNAEKSPNAEKLEKLKEKFNSIKGSRLFKTLSVGAIILATTASLLGCGNKPGNDSMNKGYDKSYDTVSAEHTYSVENDETIEIAEWSTGYLEMDKEIERAGMFTGKGRGSSRDRETKLAYYPDRNINNDIATVSDLREWICEDPENPTEEELRAITIYATIEDPVAAAIRLVNTRHEDFLQFGNDYQAAVDYIAEARDKGDNKKLEEWATSISNSYKSAELDTSLTHADVAGDATKEKGESLTDGEKEAIKYDLYNNVAGDKDKYEFRNLGKPGDRSVLKWVNSYIDLEGNETTDIEYRDADCENTLQVTIVKVKGKKPVVKIIPDPKPGGGGEDVEKKDAAKQIEVASNPGLAGKVTTDSNIGEVTNGQQPNRNTVVIQPNEDGGTTINGQDYQEPTDRDPNSDVMVDKSDEEADKKQDNANNNEITTPPSEEEANKEIESYSLPSGGALELKMDDNGNMKSATVYVDTTSQDQGGNNGQQ